ncbi:MAG: hypothetical protein HY654_05820 [Acidobacteria bacterium]|nr:hypothetical protein [Acidobacteriota bacterium]
MASGFSRKIGAGSPKNLPPEGGSHEEVRLKPDSTSSGGRHEEKRTHEERRRHGEAQSREERKRTAAAARKRDRALQELKARITELEDRIAAHERAIKELEAAMASPGFYERRDDARVVIDRHQHLMWEVGGLMQEWEELQTAAEESGQ